MGVSIYFCFEVEMGTVFQIVHFIFKNLQENN